MAKRRTNLPSNNALTRGSNVGPVQIRVNQSGQLIMAEIGIDFSKADVPDRSYYADHCEVQRARAGISLLFGKLAPKCDHLRTQVDIIFPDDLFVKQLWGSTRDMHQQLESSVFKGRLDHVGEVASTDKVQTFRANNVFIGIWTDEVVADFYYLSPRDLHYVRTGAQAEVGLEPVLRIVMSSGLLLEFFDKCRILVSELETAHEEVINT
jgi:hypothetical protein